MFLNQKAILVNKIILLRKTNITIRFASLASAKPIRNCLRFGGAGQEYSPSSPASLKLRRDPFEALAKKEIIPPKQKKCDISFAKENNLFDIIV